MNRLSRIILQCLTIISYIATFSIALAIVSYLERKGIFNKQSLGENPILFINSIIMLSVFACGEQIQKGISFLSIILIDMLFFVSPSRAFLISAIIAKQNDWIGFYKSHLRMSAFFKYAPANFLLFMELKNSDEITANIYLQKACDQNCKIAIFAQALQEIDMGYETTKENGIAKIQNLIKDGFCPAIAFMIDVFWGIERIDGIAKNHEKAFELMNKLINVSKWSVNQNDIVSRICYPHNGENGELGSQYVCSTELQFDYFGSIRNISDLICKELLDGEPSKIEERHSPVIYRMQIALFQRNAERKITYYFLGRFFEKGVGCLQNYGTSYAFYSHAVESGYSLASEKRDMVAAYLNQNERTAFNENLKKYKKLRYSDFFPQIRMRRLEKLLGIKY